MKHQKAKVLPLTKEIAWVILIKLIVLWLIWYVCFSDPIKKHLTTERMKQHLIGQIKDKIYGRSLC
ncbi:MAG: hypothetical protein A3F17_07460 [Gammaproteobacteria bacterium RIFCSPHIGHO2_12_FULL_41_15]|nr:MAG: hypothetical protein A3F17_07460 [Gammaproteobacteria bacterium RIFCSPHIGHO2_12_FULL_41_15]